MTEATVQKLEQALCDGFSVERACYLSGIGRSTFYDHFNSDLEFADKMSLAQEWATERAKQVVIQAIDDGNLKAAQWWLERKANKEFGAKLASEPQPESDIFTKRTADEVYDLMERSIKALNEADVVV
jgi:hypothetical protein